ncbi:MAG TPA: hypothetical protein VOA80_21545 [Thermoanaerobaculia bacterium]|nr:hypothetical protein [Thermoanaerobaculia bacterium]
MWQFSVLVGKLDAPGGQLMSDDNGSFEDKLDRQFRQFDKHARAQDVLQGVIGDKERELLSGFRDAIHNIIMPAMHRAEARSTGTATLSSDCTDMAAWIILSVRLGRPNQCRLTYRTDRDRNRVRVDIEEEGNAPLRQSESPEYPRLDEIDERHVQARILKLLEMGKRINLGT